MDFYNFEKYNDVFSFKKLDNDYQPLLKTYKDNYQTSLNTFLNEYEENTEPRFIESQLFFCNQEIKIQNSCIYSLEKLDHETFYYVKNRVGERHNVYMEQLNFDEDDNNSLIIQPSIENQINDNKELKAPTVVGISNEDTEEDILDMHATAKNFIKFISNRITSLCLINEFLNQRKQELEKESGTVPAFKTKNSREFSTDQQALIMVYEGNTIVTREKHGDDLYNKFTKWAKSQTRTADPDTTKLVLENKIRKFENIIPFLMEENKQKALDEIKILKSHLLKY